ncbi:MAG: rod shape-determining protein RodA [Eggerthellaceae bacterium]|nr:rod shape-determining protein RodA [Eggerthellaceae bacterium]
MPVMDLPEIQTLSSAPTVLSEKKSPLPKPLSGYAIPFLIVLAALVSYGLLICWSATLNDDSYNFSRQVLGLFIGLVAMVFVWAFDYHRLANMAIPLLVVTVILIMLPHVPGLGTDAGMGATAWINIGIQVQPGEFAKITVVLFAASLIAKYGGKLNDLREYIKCVILLLIPFVCIMTQPDLGTGLVYMFISATALVMGGARVRYMIVTVIVFIAGIVALLLIDEFVFKYEDPTSSTGYEYKILKNYQRNRLTVFLNPDANTTDEGYNFNQALIAIGSGGLFGKGIGNSTQVSNDFLPEAPTDFIFCVLGEETGFFGALALLVLYALLIFFALMIARRSNNMFGMLIVCSIVGMWLFQILENIGMDVGIMPITGIPLPFFSYGSSFMITNFVMVGLIGSVNWHHTTVGKKPLYATSP